MTSSPNLRFEAQVCREVDTLDELMHLVGKNPSEYLWQIKYDGIWGRARVSNGTMEMYSKTGQLKRTLPLNPTLSVMNRWPVTLLGEYMMGSQWSTQEDRAGKFYVFDAVEELGSDRSHCAYDARYRLARSFVKDFGLDWTEMVDCYPISSLPNWWIHNVETEKYEGVIVRSRPASYYTELLKLKREVEDDFVILGMTEGKGKHLGRMGSLTLGQYLEGELVKVMECGGGFSDEDREEFWNHYTDYIQKVVRVKGKSRFSSGALRHPNFVSLRDDKDPRQCLLKRQLQ